MLYEDHNETPMEVPMSNVSELCFSQVTYVRNNETSIVLVYANFVVNQMIPSLISGAECDLQPLFADIVSNRFETQF